MLSDIPTIFHVEDDALWRDFVAKCVAESGVARYLGSAATAGEARELLAAKVPSIAILDIFLPDGSGLEIVEMIAARAWPTRILLASVTQADAILYNLMHPTVAGMILKNTFALAELPRAIRQLASGLRYIPPDVMEALRRFRQSPDAFFKVLSNREIELLPRLARGDSDEEIATDAGISRFTVKSHRQSIMSKVGVHTTEKLMRWATERGFAWPSTA